jgi:hypothetical protein
MITSCRIISPAKVSGGSPCAISWLETVRELRSRLMDSGNLTETLLSEFERFYADPGYWTSAITFIASSGRRAV